MRKLVLAMSAALALTAWAPPASAIVVFDPSNYAQNLMTAAHTLEQIHNQIAQIDQAAHMLAQNPLQLSPELAADINAARRLFSQAQGISFDLQKLSADFQALYPQQWAQMNLGDMLAQSDHWLAQDRQSVENAMQAEAGAAAALGQSQDQIERALQSSSAAEGQTGAVQASNQLLGVAAAELAQIHALLIAQGRALETARMDEIARQQRAEQIRTRAFPSASSVSFTPARSAF
jgi:P-type conjugative transfer protein TrbJ